MKKIERLDILNKILAEYDGTHNITYYVEKYGLSAKSIREFLSSNNIEIVKLKNDKPTLEKALEELKSKPLTEVSKIYGISIEALSIASSGINKTEYKKKLIDLAINEYINTSIYDRSISKISTKYGLNKKTLNKYLKERNIEITNVKNATDFNRNAFDIIDTEEKAYWLGFMYADGYVASSKYQVGLNLSLKDIDHLKKYNKFLNYSKGLNISESHQFGSKEKINKKGEIIYMVSTVITDKQLWEGLVNKGCVPNKSLILTFPNESIFSKKLYIYDFIRGYFDGDGTLGVYPHSKTNPKLEESLMFVGTKNFLEGVQKYLGKGFLMQKPNCNEKTYRLSYSTSKANHAAELMYKNANIYLDRKYNIYINKFAAIKLGKIGES